MQQPYLKISCSLLLSKSLNLLLNLFTVSLMSLLKEQSLLEKKNHNFFFLPGSDWGPEGYLKYCKDINWIKWENGSWAMNLEREFVAYGYTPTGDREGTSNFWYLYPLPSLSEISSLCEIQILVYELSTDFFFSFCLRSKTKFVTTHFLLLQKQDERGCGGKSICGFGVTLSWLCHTTVGVSLWWHP